MKRGKFSNFSHVGALQNNRRIILTAGAICVAVLIGFYTGILYAATRVTLEGDLEWKSLATEADYVIFVDDGGIIRAKNGFTGKTDYNSTNASHVINGAMEALATTGGYIFVKQGTYSISETIRIPSKVALVGTGFGSRLVLAAGSDINIIENYDRSRGNDNILIATLHLDGNKAENPTEMAGLSFSRLRNSTIQDCQVHDFGYSGLLLYNGGGNVIQNNFVYRNRNAGIEGTHEDHDIVTNNVVYSNEGYPYGHGIDYCTGSRYNIFEGNVCYNNGLSSGGGLSLWDGFENIIIGNAITSNHVGITVGIPSFGNRTYGNMITGNMISNNTGDGLHMEGENNLVSKNTFSFNGGCGVYVDGSGTMNNTIEGNRLENNQGWQVHVTTLPSNTVIKNNLIFGNKLVENQGTNTSMKWNSGYVTESSGTAVVLAGRTSVSFENQLVSTPKYVSLTPKDNLEGRSYWYTTNSTHLTIHMSPSDAENDHWFDWSAET